MSQWVDPEESKPQEPAPAYQQQQQSSDTANVKINETITIIQVEEPNRIHVVRHGRSHYSDDDFSVGCCVGCMTAVCCCGCVMMWGSYLGGVFMMQGGPKWVYGDERKRMDETDKGRRFGSTFWFGGFKDIARD
jgi:hypothetical protein